MEHMAPLPDAGSPPAGDPGDARQKLKQDLARLENRLLTMITKYRAKSSAIDSNLDANDKTMDVEVTVADIYELMDSRVYSADNPLQLNETLREAIEDQRDDFDELHTSAETAIEAYKVILRSYNILKGSSLPRPERGDIPEIKDDVHTLIDDRIACIKAITDFHGKYFAMLKILH
jgi:hypothetical protein